MVKALVSLLDALASGRMEDYWNGKDEGSSQIVSWEMVMVSARRQDAMCCQTGKGGLMIFYHIQAHVEGRWQTWHKVSNGFLVAGIRHVIRYVYGYSTRIKRVKRDW